MKSRIKTIIFTILLAVAFAVTSAPSAADAKNVTISEKDWQNVLNKLNELTQQNKKLNTRIKKLESKKTVSGSVASDDIEILKEDVEELSELMDVVEKRSIVDKIQWGVELRTRADWFNFREKTQQRGLFGRKYNSRNHDSVQGIVSNRLRLNMRAKVSDNLKFTGRLSMYKYWHDGDFREPSQSAQGRRPTDSDIYVERAYVDYFFDLGEYFPMALTFGRLPMADGLPTNLRDNTPRKATFPSLAYDMVADGAGLSWQLDKLTGLKDTALRFIYYRRVDDDDRNVWRKTDIDIEETNVYIGQFETRLPGNILSILTVSYNPDQPTIDLTKNAPVRPIKIKNSLGSFYTATIFFQAERFLGSNFDWFLGFGYSEIDTSDEPSVYGLGPIPINVGLVGDRNERDTAAHAWHVGFRYNIPIQALNIPKFGVEYNSGSKYWMTGAWAAEDPFNKLSVNGRCWDFYYIQPINRNLMLRVGYTWLKRDYPMLTRRATSDRPRYEETITNTYLLLDAKF